jgi:hypothetical protein
MVVQGRRIVRLPRQLAATFEGYSVNHYLKAAGLTLVVMAVVFRVAALRQIVVGQ